MRKPMILLLLFGVEALPALSVTVGAEPPPTQATGVTLTVRDGSPAASPSPARVNDEVTVRFKVFLYKPDDQHKEQPPEHVRYQVYNVSAGSDSTITSASTAGASSDVEIAEDKHSVRIGMVGASASTSFVATVVVEFGQTGAKNVTMNATVRFDDDSTVTATHTIQVSIGAVSIRVERDTTFPRSIDAKGYSYRVKITIIGDHLSDLSIRQIIRSSVTVRRWDGTNVPREELVAAFGPTADTNGQWITDTGWDWTWLGERAKAVLADDQELQVRSRVVTIGEMEYEEVQLAAKASDFKIQLQDDATGKVVAEHPWGYTWDNFDATWTAQSTPPAPDPACARMDLASSSFRNTYGIEGVPWQ